MTNDLIVCAIDFSPQSARALEWAKAMTGQGGRIDLVHVVPAPTTSMEALAVDAGRFEAARDRQAREDLAKLAGAASGDGFEVRPRLLVGDAHRELVEHARKEGARLLVMGASKRSTLGRWVLGGVVERTVRFASCPVAIIPGDYDLRPWASGAGRARSPRVLVGLDDEGGSRSLYDLVVELRRRKGCDLDFLHFYWPIEELNRLGLRGPRDLFSPDPDVIANLEPKLRGKIAEEVEGRSGTGAIALEIRPAWGEPAANLLLVTTEREADLLVVGLEPRRGLARFFGGSVAERLAHHASRLAMVAVPEGAAPARSQAAVPRIATVLAATDFSEASRAAIPQAYALLRASGGVVELCHVFEHGLPSPPYAYDRPEGHLSPEKRAVIEDELRALVPEEAAGLGITTHVTVIDGGRAGEAIVQAAERLNTDVIAVASEGRTGIARAVMGSVAQEVLHRARRPVFVIRS